MMGYILYNGLKFSFEPQSCYMKSNFRTKVKDTDSIFKDYSPVQKSCFIFINIAISGKVGILCVALLLFSGFSLIYDLIKLINFVHVHA